MVINWGLAEDIGSWTVAVHALLLVVLLIKFTGTNLVPAGIVTFLFFAVEVALVLALDALLKST